MKRDEEVQWGRPFPAGKTSEGTYIDDHLVFQEVPSAARRQKKGFRDIDITWDSLQAFESCNFGRSEEEGIRYQPRPLACRTWMDGVRGARAAPVGRRLEAMSLGRRLLHLGKASGETLEKWAGPLVHSFSH